MVVEEKTSKLLEKVLSIADEIYQERKKQDEKWGIQEHPSVLDNKEIFTDTYGIVKEGIAKLICNKAFEDGNPTWSHIAVEELSEVIFAGNEKDRRTEIVQLIAVLCGWLECIDRRNGR